jgi:hypothetical protein
VRDAAVTLLVAFKAILYTSQIVTESISMLPKYRVQEISQRSEERIPKVLPAERGPSSQMDAKPISAGRAPERNAVGVFDLLDNNHTVQLQPVLSQTKQLGEIIVETLESDFEKGLHLIKGLASNPSQIDFPQKDIVLSKLLETVSVIC